MQSFIAQTTPRFDSNPIKIKVASLKFFLLGRVAASFVGKIVSPTKPSLHFTLIIYYPNGDTFGIDGQPTGDIGKPSFNPSKTLANMKLIKSNFYKNKIPEGAVVKSEIFPPKEIDSFTFEKMLITNAYNFASYTIDYSIPKNISGNTMLEGEFNSSSYLAGLLNSVMGYVPDLSFSDYQTPGWEKPIPKSYYKGEAMK